MRISLGLIAFVIALSVSAEPIFRMPTPNLTLYDGPESAAKSFFAPTQSGHWESGRFGCTRTAGWQFHEGIDIRYTQRDKKGEPTDPIFATAKGTVCYINSQPGLSNYGIYVVIGHQIEGLEVFSIYAHLSKVSEGVVAGRKVEAGARIGTMGRTSNAASIGRHRAHLHFEITLAINEEYAEWFQINFPDQTNDHGPWNGRNFLGLDPEDIFKEQLRQGDQFKLRNYIRDQQALFSVYIPKKSFPWMERYKPLVLLNPDLKNENITGYNVSFNGFGLPFHMHPVNRKEKVPLEAELTQVNAELYEVYKCRRLLSKNGKTFQLSKTTLELIDLLIFNGN